MQYIVFKYVFQAKVQVNKINVIVITLSVQKSIATRNLLLSKLRVSEVIVIAIDYIDRYIDVPPPMTVSFKQMTI